MEGGDKFEKVFETTLAKNVDRIIPFEGRQGKEYLAATYHLNKETQTKSGSITLLRIDESQQR